MSAFETKLVEAIESTVYDPLKFVKLVYPWGEPGALEPYSGPDKWQERLLIDLGEQLKSGHPVRMATTSGHGVGKSSLVAWLVQWFISTRPHPQIVVTANTREQLLKKTFRELSVWHKRLLNKHWFEWTATKFYHKSHPETWFAAAVPWSAENSEAFAGTHAKHVLVIFDEACHDDKTEVLTSVGWRLFKDLTGAEELLTMNPETGQCFYETPTRLFVSPYDGEMWEYTNRGVNFCVTPRHKMWEQRYSPHSDNSAGYTKWRATPIAEITAKEFYIPKTIPVWEGAELSHFLLPEYAGERKRWEETAIPMLDWMWFLGWYYSEGSLTFQANGRPCEVRVAQKDPAALHQLCNKVSEWGCSASVYTSPTTPQLSIRHRGLAEYLYTHGKGCLEKRLPPEVRQATRGQQRVFLDAFCQGDGYVKGNRRILYTSNKGLADDLHEVALKAGYNSTVTVRSLKGKIAQFATHTATSSCDGYVISLAESDPRAKVRQAHIRKIAYSGVVYCAEVPTHHLLLTRRNGVAMWSGNSGVDDVIWEVTEGAMTTEGACWATFGNPTRNTGRFRECFGSFRHRWTTYKVDGRDALMTNKVQLNQWIEDYGEDSDFCRVRIKGEFPRAGSNQFIPSDFVERCIAANLPDDLEATKALGVDVARFGTDQSIILRRHGRKVAPLRKFRGVDTMQLAAYVAEEIDEWEPDAVFVDGNGLGAGVVDRLRSLNYRVIDVLGQSSPNNKDKYANKSAEMWGEMRDWLRGDSQIPDDPGLRDGLIGREYGHNARNAIQLEKKEDMKARGLVSPDEADALALTFAEPVRAHRLIQLPEGVAINRGGVRNSRRHSGLRRDLDWRL